MKYLKTLILFAYVSMCLSGCSINYMKLSEMAVFLGGIVEKIGDSQITEDNDLIGQRDLKDDTYCGRYVADCNSKTGRDVIFGGASIHERDLLCHGSIQAEAGEANIRIRLNDEVIILQTDETGTFETELNMKSGGNYIMIDYSDFSGSTALFCEYSEE